VQERLLTRALDVRDAVHVDTLRLQVGDGVVEVVDTDREVVRVRRLRVRLHQVHLLPARVEPVTRAEVGPWELRHAQHVAVERETQLGVGDTDGDVVHSSRFHDPILPRTLPGCMWADPSIIDTTLDSRAVTFENTTGARGAGGRTRGGRKGAPSRLVRAGETVELCDVAGPGTVRHIWCTVPPALPEAMRALVLEVFYDGRSEPSVSVPLLDFFGLPLGRPVPYASALTTAQEGRGFNAYFPMPFRERLRATFTNSSPRPVMLYYQIDYTLGPVADDAGVLHVTFRRENPTTMRRDFTIVDGLRGPGRFLGCAIGVRPIDRGSWYGEGEVKVYRDGDDEGSGFPTICGTGLEDYVGSAWGMGAHHAPFAGAPIDVRPGEASIFAMPDFVAFYRWHVPDPIVFTATMHVTIQQIGMHLFLAGQETEQDAYLATNPPAGAGWARDPRPGVIGMGICERVDDYSAAAFVYCHDVQAVPRVDVVSATSDLGRRAYESAAPMEAFFA
jgi:D-arabinan exo alpha-(1,3)/(1,5)-arabinofuranosidase (non-reducing end)